MKSFRTEPLTRCLRSLLPAIPPGAHLNCDKFPVRVSVRNRPGSHRLREGNLRPVLTPCRWMRLARTTNEQSRSGYQRERECNLCDDERITRQKLPVATHHIFASMFFQLRDHCVARNFQSRPEREQERAEQAKPECRRQNCGFGPVNQTMSSGISSRIEPKSKSDDQSPRTSPLTPPSNSTKPSVRSWRTIRQWCRPARGESRFPCAALCLARAAC